MYEDKAAGENAWRTLRDITHKLTGEPQAQPKLWRFDLLEDPACFALALADAYASDLLVVSLAGAEHIPLIIQRWLEVCLPNLKEKDTAIVTIFGQTADLPYRTKSSAHQFVGQQARSMGLSLFSTELPVTRPNLN